MRAILISLFILGSSTAQVATETPAEFLRGLMRDPSRVPVYNEGLQVADQIAALTQAQVRSTLPVIFEALASERDAVKLNAALALHAVALRPDGRILLEPRIDEVLALMNRNDERLKMTAPMVVTKLGAPSEKTLARLVNFIGDRSQPPSVKVVVVCALSQIAPNHVESRAASARFLDGDLDVRVRIDAINALACLPSDDSVTAQAVGRNLRSESADVRAAAVQVLGRLGPKAADLNRSALLEIANRSDERPDIQKLAARVAAMSWNEQR
jgi:HEAT repeat protein